MLDGLAGGPWREGVGGKTATCDLLHREGFMGSLGKGKGRRLGSQLGVTDMCMLQVGLKFCVPL